jgi:hypothetical protein
MAAQDANADALNVLRLATEWESWLQRNRRGSTFSTFVDEFGYDEIGADTIYRRVEAVRQMAFTHIPKGR